jgi:hypothetical protein
VLRQIIGDLEPRCLVCDKDMPLRAQSGVAVERSQSKEVAKFWMSGRSINNWLTTHPAKAAFETG